MANLDAKFRAKLFRAVHAEALKRGIDHDGLHNLCRERSGSRSMSEMSNGDLEGLYHEWTNKKLKRVAKLPRKGEAAAAAEVQIVSGDELVELGREFAKRGIGEQGRGDFIARQLRGRREIRTRRDWVKVFAAVRAMNRRDAKTKAEGARV